MAHMGAHGGFAAVMDVAFPRGALGPASGNAALIFSCRIASTRLALARLTAKKREVSLRAESDRQCSPDGWRCVEEEV
jgi:hypothetical protein